MTAAVECDGLGAPLVPAPLPRCIVSRRLHWCLVVDALSFIVHLMRRMLWQPMALASATLKLVPPTRKEGGQVPANDTWWHTDTIVCTCDHSNEEQGSENARP